MNGQRPLALPLTSGAPQLANDPFRDLRWVSSGIGLVTVCALVLTWWHGYVLSGWRFQPQMLWAIALWSAAATMTAVSNLHPRLRSSMIVPLSYS